MKCAQRGSSSQNLEQCQCSDSERQLTQTYCTPEINFALNCGYRIVHIHEILEWTDSEKYDPTKKQGGLFSAYINTFLKLKQEANGYPRGVSTDEEKKSYINEYFEKEGIQLDQSRIHFNPGLRSTAKLALNSFYGKLGQHSDQVKTKFITELSQLIQVLMDRTIKVKDYHFLSENVMQVDFVPNEDFPMQAPNSNVPLAAFCTTYARLELLKLMRSVEGRVLYHDTDSVIFTARPGDFIPPTGQFLGELTNELECTSIGCKEVNNCVGHFIQEFVSCGAKNYAYKLNTGETVCKVRGFSLTYAASQIINMESMKESLFAWMKNDPRPEMVTVKCEIRRDKKNVKIVNKRVCKQYSVVYDKRVVQPDFSTVPYGYR